MPKQSGELRDVFHALSDSTRLAVLERLSRGPAAVSELAAPFDMALPSFMQHLRVLERGGLVSSRKVGRTRMCALAPRRLQQAERWLVRQRQVWERRLDQLDDYLLSEKENEDED